MAEASGAAIAAAAKGGNGMEPYPGVFVTSASTGDWERDPDVKGTEMHELVHADGVWAGLTSIATADDPLPFTPETREVALVLEGSARIELAGGGTIEVGVGDYFSLPPGVDTVWHVTAPFKEAWVLASD
jgi:uncharacterized cupin superfamily protein